MEQTTRGPRDVISERLLGAWMSASAASMEATPQQFCDKFADIVVAGLREAGYIIAHRGDMEALAHVLKAAGGQVLIPDAQLTGFDVNRTEVRTYRTEYPASGQVVEVRERPRDCPA